MKKFKLPSYVQKWLDNENTTTGYNQKNIYSCGVCRREIITIDVDKGVTPFMVGCRATPNCKGVMTSSFYKCDPERVAQYEWYRPDSLDGLADEEKQHVMQGGLLLRSISTTDKGVDDADQTAR